MKKIIIFFIFITVFNSLISQNNQAGFSEKFAQDLKQFKQEQESKFQNYYIQQDSLFIQYKDEIERLWNEFKESSAKEWVSYNSDFSCRSAVDFETGEIKIEAIAEADEQGQGALESISNQLKLISSETADSDKPILSNQIKNPLNKQETLKAEEIDKITKKLLKNSKKDKITGKDGKTRIKYTLSLNMVPNHIKIRAERYKDFIAEKCEKFKIDPAFAMAIIHTESFFNPKAYNRHGNAYGIMQIVPKYAGLTMNNHLYHKNEPPSPQQLFNPKINMEMGIGYLRWLADYKWENIKNEDNLYYCLICSYNGGPGTIYKAMTGKMKNISQEEWDDMIDKLNNEDNKVIFSILEKEVPWKETREYLKKVVNRKNKYYSSVNRE
jgi:membrane-bound lytic murein transglycosylase C